MTKILIVDDVAFFRMRLATLLETHGYEVLEAADGVQAIEVYQSTHPDMVFMDITMPNKNGIEALAEIVRSDTCARVIMLTSLGQEAMVHEAFRLGAKDFLLKPYNNERLLETVERVLG